MHCLWVKKIKERKELIDSEIPINRGNSGIHFCNRLFDIANNNIQIQ